MERRPGLRQAPAVSSPVQESKRLWRSELHRRLRNLNPESRTQQSLAIRQRIVQLPQWCEARHVLLFYSRPDEPDMLPLWESLTRAGRVTAFPAYVAEAGHYVARVAGPWSPGKTLPPGAFGIPEPPMQAPALPGNQLDFVVVPGLGFDSLGRRLGRGRGFYDRLLTGVRGFRCGVAFDEQCVDVLPSEPHDVRVDCLLTPSQGRFYPPART